MGSTLCGIWNAEIPETISMIAVNVKLKGLFPSETLKQKLKTLRLLEEI